MNPVYLANFVPSGWGNTLLAEVPWEEHTPARKECFMTEPPGKQYTYGVEKWARTYTSVKMHPLVQEVMNRLNYWHLPDCDSILLKRDNCSCEVYNNDYNVCFLNLYDTEKNMLGWHADDSPTMDHDHPIASVSFGEAREIWWRPNGQKGVVPPEQRQLLASGSAFIMPAGFQRTHQHRIPKGDRAMKPRISLTFRRFVG